MNNLFIMLGNGFSIEFIECFDDYQNSKGLPKSSIEVKNLFAFGESIRTPWDSRLGFLSYKNCPALWTLGARPGMELADGVSLIEEIISCANMYSEFIYKEDQRNKRVMMETTKKGLIYLEAYSELIQYLSCLFVDYDSRISDNDLEEFVMDYKKWEWLPFLKKVHDEGGYRITFVTYNYDIWLERILKCIGFSFDMEGFEDEGCDVKIIKPHGSIGFEKKNERMRFEISHNIDFSGTRIDDLQYSLDIMNNRLIKSIIPPAGDSSRLNAAEEWTNHLRKKAKLSASSINGDEEDIIIMCGLSYWHVDRREIDEILINLDNRARFYLVNPNPPRDLNAVVMTIFDNYVLLTSSRYLGGVISD